MIRSQQVVLRRQSLNWKGLNEILTSFFLLSMNKAKKMHHLRKITRKLYELINPPGGQSLLGICCVDGHFIPTGQSVQFKLPTSAYWPGSQGTGYACGMHKRRGLSQKLFHRNRKILICYSPAGWSRGQSFFQYRPTTERLR